MTMKWKIIGIVLLVAFLAWGFFIYSPFGGCPPGWAVKQIDFNPNTSESENLRIVHVTDQDVMSRPYLREAFQEGKWILLPVGSITDHLPGIFFGPNYALHRISWEDRERFMSEYRNSSIWEYDGRYYRFIAFTC